MRWSLMLLFAMICGEVVGGRFNRNEGIRDFLYGGGGQSAHGLFFFSSDPSEINARPGWYIGTFSQHLLPGDEIYNLMIYGEHNSRSRRLSAGIHRFGRTAYFENILFLSCGLRLFENFNIGIRTKGLFLKIGEGETYSAFDFEIGAGISLSRDVRFSMLVEGAGNLFKSSANHFLSSTRFQPGLTWQVTEETQVITHFRKEVGQPLLVLLGLKYLAGESWEFSAGLRSPDYQMSTAISTRFKNISLGGGLKYQSLLGFSPAIEVVWKIK